MTGTDEPAVSSRRQAKQLDQALPQRYRDDRPAEATERSE
jgi:hypothetical protein